MKKPIKIKLGQIYKVGSQSLHGFAPAVRHRFMSMGIMPGALLKVLCQAPFGGPVKIEIGDGEVSLRKDDLHKLAIEQIKE